MIPIPVFLPFLPYIIAAGLAVFGLGANAWIGFTDWQTAAIFTAALLACVYVSQSNSPWTRTIIMAIIGVALYLKGQVDKEAVLLPQHVAEKRQIHKAYADAAEAEKARQRAANARALAEAERDKKQYDDDVAALGAQVADLMEKAAKDERADQPSLSLDAVRRLNALRMRGSPGS